MPTILTIADITDYLRRVIDQDDYLQDTWIQGEVSNMTVARSGHWYFTLKDKDAALRCVMWRGNAARQATTPAEGDQLIAHGKVSLYTVRGDLQFYADYVRPVGLGDLYAQYEQLKATLAEEGLFDPTHKRPIPAFPRCIGVVTSADAAAFRDVQNVLQRRFPLARVLLSPALVQGGQAPAQLTTALQRLDTSEQADVVLLVRGGGSIEDLWAFNDEGLARAIFATKTPVISGVGHETDFTIADFVADQRAPTPSAAAELATTDIRDLRATLRNMSTALYTVITRKLETNRTTLTASERTLQLVSPAGDIRTYQQRLDERGAALTQGIDTQFARRKDQLAARGAALYSASPQALLERGYSMITDDNGAVIRRQADVQSGDKLTLHVSDGQIDATAD